MRTRFGIAQDEAGTASSPVLHAVAAPVLAALESKLSVAAPEEIYLMRSFVGVAEPVTAAPGGASSGGSINGSSGGGQTQRISQYYDSGQSRYEFSGNQDIDAVLIGSKWSSTSLTFSFPTSGSFYQTPYYDSGYLTNHVVFNTAQQTAVRYALGLISGYTLLSFTEVTESNSAHANLRFSQTTDSSLVSAEGNFPGSDSWDGDVWFGQTGQPFYLTPQIGNWGQATIMHETGHALGLKHGHSDYTSFNLSQDGYVDGPGPRYGSAALDATHDSWPYSLMTYRSASGYAADFQGDEFNQPQTYMQNDIAALQYLYGAGFGYNSGNTTYTFSSTTGEMFVDGVGQGVPTLNGGLGKIFRTIWDGNGIDTYDFSNFTGNQSINLGAGAWSTMNTAQLVDLRPLDGGVNVAGPGNIANALLYNNDTRSLIENAIGGSGHDAITGNQAANALTGNGGDDALMGGLGNDSLSGDEGNDTLWQNGTLTSGAAGNDTMRGGIGDDTYIVESAGSQLIEDANAGADLVASTISFTLGANFENLSLLGWVDENIDGTGNALNNKMYGSVGSTALDGMDGNDTLEGDSGNDFLSGGAGDDRVDGESGDDYLHGDAGNDTYVVDTLADFIYENADEGTDTVESLVTLTLGANFENLTLLGSNAINGTGNALNNVLTGNSAANVLTGGAGNDTYIIDDAADVVTEVSGEGTDTVLSSITWSLNSSGANVENLTLTGTATTGSGNGLNNVMTGNASNNALSGWGGDDVINAGDGQDQLDGGGGADTLTGGLGNDVYFIDNAADLVVEVASQGTDSVSASISYTLTADVEWLTLSGTASNAGTGNALNNSLTGNAGDNSLNGAGGTDTLIGGLGNDSYTVDNAGDVVTENSGEGTDLVQASVAWTLTTQTHVENLTLTGTGNISGTGNAGNNVVTGNSGNNALSGGTGTDSLTGGAGNDTYTIDDASDVVTELSGEGTDTVLSSVTWSLTSSGANVENLTLTGTAANGTGNTLANSLTGNSAANLLDGGTGNDTLTGGAGNDTYVVNVATDVVIEAAGEGVDEVQSAASWTLGADVENLLLTGGSVISGTGNALANKLTGNTTTNALTGGAGNDTYYIQNTSDTTVEQASEGTDYVVSSVSWTLAANTENLTLTGTANLSGTGNDLDNTLTGNSGNNILRGGLGNDIYYIQNAGDSVEEAHLEGTADQIVSTVTYSLFGRAVEVLILTGSDNINATGNSLYNSLHGNSGANILEGAGGDDNLKGNGGADTFLFLTGSGADTVKDFSATDNDNINVNAYTAGVANSGIVTQSGANVLITLGSGNTITVEAATTADVLAHMVW